MKKYLLLGLLCATFAFSQPETKSRVAVMDLETSGIEASTAVVFSDRLRTELLNTGMFDVMERNRMELLLQEQGFQQSGACSSTECMVQAGQILGVDRMIAGSVGKVGNLYSISVQMIDIESGRMVISQSEDCDCPIEKVLTESVPNIANKLAVRVSGGDVAEIKDGKKKFPWLWLGLGAIAIGGGVAALSSGGDSGSENTGDTPSGATGSINIEGSW